MTDTARPPTDLLEVVRSFRLKRETYDDDSPGRVERTELFLALENLTAWHPPERDSDNNGGGAAPGVTALRSLLGGDTVTETRMGELIGYVDRSFHYYQARRANESEHFTGDMARAVAHFHRALELLVENTVAMTTVPYG